MKILRPDSYPALFAVALLSRNPKGKFLKSSEIIFELINSELKIEPDVIAYLAQTGMSDPGGIESARQTAQQWLDAGIRVVVVEASDRQVLFTQGDAALLDFPASTMLNSRTPKQLHPHDRWVKVAKHLSGHCVPSDHAIIGSIGNYSYELAGYLAVQTGRNLIVVCDRVLPGMANGKPENSDALAEFAKHPQVMFVSPFFPGRKVAARQTGVIRDSCVIALADSIWAVEIRGGGNMERLCLEALDQGKKVSAFRPNRFDRAATGNQRLIEAGAVPIEVSDAESGRTKHRKKQDRVIKPEPISSEPRLFHFTRACPGPWPGQPAFDYYQSVVDDEPGSGHNAFDTLIRILEERRIRGSNRLTRGSERVVSFTAGGLDELGRMIQWRTGFARWTFEPYGIGFLRSPLMERGARPVVYGDESVWKRLPKARQYRYQVSRPESRQWEREKEWRLKGDLMFESIPDHDILVVVGTDDEAEEIRDRFRLETLPVFVSE